MIKINGIKYQFLVPFQILLAIGLFLIGYTAFAITERAVIDSALLNMRTRSEQLIDQTQAFHRKAQSDLALAMEHPLFQEYFALPDTRAGNRYDENKVIQFSEAQQEVKSRLDQWTLILQKRFPIVETCLIDRTGQEHSRITRGEIAPTNDYSSEENGAAFFDPTFKLNAGEVHVAAPYMSPDAEEWVFAYTSPVVMPDGSKPGLYHYEIPLARFQQLVQLENKETNGHRRLLIVDPEGLIVADSSRPIDLKIKKTGKDGGHGDEEEHHLADYLPNLATLSEDAGLAAVLPRIKEGQAGWTTFHQEGELYYAVFQPMPTFGWSMMEIKTYDALLEGEYSLTRIKSLVLLMAMAIFLLAGAITWLVAHRVTRPIQGILAVLADMTRGDMTVRLPATANHNEVDDIASGINSMADGLSRNIRMIHMHGGSVTAFIKEILKIRKVFDEQQRNLRDNASEAARENQQLAGEMARIHDAVGQMLTASGEADGSSQRLATAIADMAQASGEVSGDVATVAASTEAIDSQLKKMSQHMDHSKLAMDQVAEAIRRISDSFEQIGGLTDRATRESAQAERLALETREGMTQLSRAAGEIGAVVELINGISEQTNMLSLNAAIEAAGAGQFGKGFAVVANEVKELARQTGEATQQIFDRVQEIQDMARNMVTKVDLVASNIQHLHQGNQEISHQVAGQVVETREITTSVTSLAQGADEAAESARQLGDALGQAAEAAAHAAHRTREIASASALASEDSGHVAHQNAAISTLAVEVQDAVNRTQAASQRVLVTMDNSLYHAEYLKGVIAHFRSLGDVARQISGDLFNSQSGVDIGLEPFNIRRMKEIHLNLMGRLEKTLFGKGDLEARQVARPDICPMGQMLASDEMAHLHHAPNYARIVDVHAQGHQAAAAVVNAMAKSRRAEAEAAFQQFCHIGETLFAELNLLYLSLENVQKSDRYVSWNSARHDTGWASLNAFHQGMVERMNSIFLALRDQEGDQEVAQRLDNLLAFCEPQFLAEQQEMARLGFPDQRAHGKEHDFFRWKTLDIIAQYHEDEFSIHWDLLHFLQVWLVRHASQMDQALGRFLAQQQKMG